MYRVLVRMSVKNFDALAEYERKAAAIMQDYQGRILLAHELERVGQLGDEVHVVDFPNQALFDQYRQDKRLVDLAELRVKAIDSIVLNVLGAEKNYYL